MTEYEYRGLMAATWDLFRGDTSQWADRFLYRDLIGAFGQPVLDVGCGTGRLLLDYLADGIDIEGVDNSPEMLELCREKAARAGLNPTLYLQEMESLTLPRAYRAILVPSSSFQLLTDKEQARQAMLRFREHLLPGGVLMMPFMKFGAEEEDPQEPEWRLTGEKAQEDGILMRRREQVRFDPADGCAHTKTRYEAWRDGELLAQELHERSPATRSYTQQEAVALYAEAGLKLEAVYREFTREPAQPEDAIFTLVGRR